LGIDECLGAFKRAEALLVDNPVAAYDGIVALGDGYLGIGLVSIEDNDDVAPIIAPCIVLKAIGHRACWRIEEFEVLAQGAKVPDPFAPGLITLK